MKERFTKFIVLALSLALLIGAAVGIAVSAEEDTAPEIISKNVWADGNFCLMFAIDPATVAGDDVSVKIYNVDPTGLEGEALASALVYNATKAKTETQLEDLDGDRVADDSVIVFTTGGVPAKDIADEWYIVTESAGIVSDVETYSVREYAFERLYKDQTILAANGSYEYRQKQFYLSILSVGSAAQDLNVNFDLEAEGKEPERLASEYCYAAVQNGTFSGDLTGTHGFVEIGDTLTLTENTGFTDPSWKVYTYGTNGALDSVDTVVLGSTIEIKGNTVVVPGWAEGLTPGKYFADIGNDALSFDTASGFSDTGFVTNTTAAGSNYGHNSIIAEAGRGNVLNVGKLETETGKAKVWIPVVDTANGSGNCLVIEMDYKFSSKLYYNSASEYSTGKSTGTVWTILSAAANATDSGGWNGTNTIANWNNHITDNTGSLSAENPVGGTEWNINDKATLDFDKWYNVCFEIYDASPATSNKIVIKVFIDGEYVGNWSGNVSSNNTTEFNAPSLAKSIRIDWQERCRPNETHFDNIFVGVIEKEYSAN